MVLLFGDCELDLDRVELRVDGQPRPVEPQVFEVLAHLVRHRDRMVSKDELLDEVWRSRFVTESAVSSRIKSARRAIGDDGRAQRLIRTVHGRGYQFVGEVRAAQPPPVPQPVTSVPRQLPLAVPGFSGRAEALDRLDALLDQADGASAAVISAVSGTAGIGKTTLAVHWSHRVADRFPDGQLYVNLRGFDPSGVGVDPAEALRGFLDALGVPVERRPDDLTGQAALYRSVLSGKRVLVVLDNARDAEQARPLLPGSAGCLALVTSRARLTALVAIEGATPVALDLLSPDEARALLASRLGPQRVAAESAAADDLVRLCCRLPLALAIAAARAATSPDLPLGALVEELRDAGRALDALHGGDVATDVRGVLSWSYRLLSPPAARLLRLSTLHPGPDLTATAAASLAGAPLGEVRRLLAELTGAHLLTERAPGRYVCHDLLRAYATEERDCTDSAADQRAATRRLLDQHLHTAHHAVVVLETHYDRIDPPAAVAGVTVQGFADHEQAEAWLSAELPALLGLARTAATTGHAVHAWQLAWTLSDVLEGHGLWHDWHTVAAQGLRVACAAGDRLGQAHAHRDLARACSQLRRHDDALEHARQALALFEEAAADTGRAPTHLTLGQLLERCGEVREALAHSRHALELFRAGGHARGEAYALNAVGWQHALLGEHRLALECCRQALTRLRDLGDERGEADTWDSLGLAHQGLAEHDEAVRCYRRALELYSRHTARWAEALTLDKLGDALASRGDAAAAREAWERALAGLEALGDPHTAGLRAKLWAPAQRRGQDLAPTTGAVPRD